MGIVENTYAELKKQELNSNPYLPCYINNFKYCIFKHITNIRTTNK